MKKESLFLKTLVVFMLLNFTLHPVTGSIFENKIEGNICTIEPVEEFSPGEIIDISFSNQYPTLGEPIEIIVTVQGNPTGFRFSEIIEVSDEYEGIIVKSSEAKWKSGNVTFDPVEIKIGRLHKYMKKIHWYPVVVGNHTLKFKAGSFTVLTRNISVGFATESITYPSIGCPSIISKSQAEEFFVVSSEERAISEDILDILQVELISVDGSSTYELDSQISVFNTWIYVSEDKIEDELISSYDVSSIPCGFYDLSVTTLKETYMWPHAVKIIDEEPDEFNIVHLTDLHIGKRYNIINENKNLEKMIRYINEEIKPDFIIISGDLIDWHNDRSIRNFYDELKEIMQISNSPIFTTPGNHERYGNGVLALYAPFYDMSGYLTYLNPLCDYAFEYGEVNFVFLDSGYDWSRWEIQLRIFNLGPEGSGLTNNQMEILENDLGNSNLNQIITMHHPAVNEIDDAGLGFVRDNHPSGNDECIAFNRVEFIEYCLISNVSLVLSGHTHNNIVLDFLGEDAIDPCAWPMFVQTDSTTLNRVNVGGRVIDIEDGQVINYEYISLTYDDFFLT